MRQIRYIYIVIMMILAYSCKQDELCYDHNHYPYVRVNVDLGATGLTFSQLQSYSVIFYPHDDGIISLEDLEEDVQKFRIQTAYDFTVQVKPGTYDVLLYSDYTGQVAFSSTGDYELISAYAITSKNLSYVRSDVGAGVSVIPMPDPVVIGKVEQFVVDDVDVSLSNIKDIHFSGKMATSEFDVEFWIRNSNSMSGLRAYVGRVNNSYYISQQRGVSDGEYDMYVGEDGDSSDIDGRTVVSYEKFSEVYEVLPEDDLPSYYNTYYYRKYKILGCTFGFTELNDDAGDGGASQVTRSDEDLGGDAGTTSDYSSYIYFVFTLKTGEVEVSDLYELDFDKLAAGETIEIGSQDEPAAVLPELIDYGTDNDDGGFKPGVGDWDDEVEVGPYELQ